MYYNDVTARFLIANGCASIGDYQVLSSYYENRGFVSIPRKWQKPYIKQNDVGSKPQLLIDYLEGK